MIILNEQYLTNTLNITDYTSRKELRLYANLIDEIEPTLFHNCQHLEILYLHENKIKSLNKETFKHCNQLKRLDLDSNLIDEIEPTLFHNCQHLEQLWLNENKIKSLNKETFKHCNKLKRLDLSNNFLEKIDPKLFHICQHLRILYLRGNQIKSLTIETFKNCYRLKRLYLDSTKFDFIKNFNQKKICLFLYNSSFISYSYLQPECLNLILKTSKTPSFDLFLHQYIPNVNEFCVIDKNNNLKNEFKIVSFFFNFGDTNCFPLSFTCVSTIDTLH